MHVHHLPPYRPEIDMSEELSVDDAAFCMSQVGALRWMVELGRVDIITETSMLASHSALPRQGHLKALLHVYGYLEKNHNAVMVFDPTYPTIDYNSFNTCDWSDFYQGVEEEIPPNAPKARGKAVDIRMMVDADFAGDQRTRRSRSGYIIFINMAPVDWMSKKQSTCETSVFGAEFIAMKVAMEASRAIRHKLRMMGVELTGPTYTYGDNMSVIHNTQRPESVLRKKSNSVCYHAVRESVAMGEMITSHIRSEHNAADICTKIITSKPKRDSLVRMILYYLAD